MASLGFRLNAHEAIEAGRRAGDAAFIALNSDRAERGEPPLDRNTWEQLRDAEYLATMSADDIAEAYAPYGQWQAELERSAAPWGAQDESEAAPATNTPEDGASLMSGLPRGEIFEEAAEFAPLVERYAALGLSMIPIDLGVKGPKEPGWPDKGVKDAATALRIFGKGTRNLGVVLGQRSGGIIDIDLDCPEALALTDYLPATSAVFGRDSTPRSHLIYSVEGFAPTKKFIDPLMPKDSGEKNMIVEVRGDGNVQTVFPPSRHPSGETIAWNQFDEIAAVTYEELVSAATNIAVAVMVKRYGDKGRNHPKVKEWLGETVEPRHEAPQPEARPHTGERHEASKREIAATKGLLKSLADKLAATGDGSRNIVLNNVALAMGHEVAVGRISRAEVYEALLDACRRNGWLAHGGQRAFDATFRSGFEAGLLEPAGPLEDRPRDGAAQHDDPEYDIEAVKERIKENEQREAEDIKNGGNSLADDLLKPDGVLGEMVDYILETSNQPIREFAIASAVAILGTVTGRRVAGPTHSGTHLYIALLAPTAGGKGRGPDVAMQMLREVDIASNGKALRLIGPGSLASGPGLWRHIHDNPLSLSVFAEFGNTLSGISSPKAPQYLKEITGILRDAWSKSFGYIDSKARADGSDADAEIKWPAYSLIGASTAEEFFGALTSKEATNGLLNRFIVFIDDREPEYVHRPPGDKSRVPQAIIDRLLDLHLCCMGNRPRINLRATVKDPSLMDDDTKIVIGFESDEVDRAFEAFSTEMFKRKTKKNQTAPLYGRVAENAIRLATIHAVSRDGLHAKITMRDLEWGQEIALFSARKLVKEAALRISDNEYQADVNRILRIIKNGGAGGVAARDLQRKLKGNPGGNRFETAMGVAIKGEMIVPITERRADGKPGRSKTIYYINPDYDYED